jgi:hypothetical protein
MEIESLVNKLVSFNSDYKCLRSMKRYKRRYDLRSSRKTHSYYVQSLIADAVNLNIFKDWSDFELSDCETERLLYSNFVKTYDPKTQNSNSGEGHCYYRALGKLAAFLIMYEFITHNHIVCNEFVEMDAKCTGNKFSKTVYKKLLECIEQCKQHKIMAQTRDKWIGGYTKNKLTEKFNYYEKKLTICKKIYEVDMK